MKSITEHVSLAYQSAHYHNSWGFNQVTKVEYDVPKISGTEKKKYKL